MLRDRLYRQRLTLGERRNELRQERTELAAIDTKFMNLIRQSWDSGVTPDIAQVENIYAELESKRDELGTIQYDYDTIEADHDLAETRFEEEEQKLEKLISRFLSLGANSATQSSVQCTFKNLLSQRNSTAEPRLYRPDLCHRCCQ